MNIKICSNCKRVLLDQIDFYLRWHNINNRYYYKSICRKCHNIDSTKRRLKDPKKHLESVKRYQAKNRELVRKRWRDYYYKKYNNWVNFLKELGYTKCSKCGYDKCFAALDFHHDRNRRNGKKDLTISQIISGAFTEERKKLLLEELKDCIILCANCHRELHYKEKHENRRE